MIEHKDYYPGVSWEEVNTPEEMGWSTERLQEAKIFSDEIGSAAVLVVTGGKIVAAWGETTQRFSCHSMRKSLLSSLIGISVSEGQINLSRTVADFKLDDNEPNLTAKEKEATVADMLKARSGIYHPSNCQLNTGLPERGSYEHGTFWFYNNWDFNALGTIFELSTQESIFAAFNQRIAAPLHMEDFEVENIYYRFRISTDMMYWFEVPMHEFEHQGPLFLRRDQWQDVKGIQIHSLDDFPDQSCYYVGGPASIHPCYWFRMSARDLARFGWLFLCNGMWEDKQIVPEDWVKESTTAYSSAWSGSGFGYMWWVAVDGNILPDAKLPDGTYAALGSGGHCVIVLPALDTVIVHRINTDIPEARVNVSRAQLAPMLQAILDARLK